MERLRRLYNLHRGTRPVDPHQLSITRRGDWRQSRKAHFSLVVRQSACALGNGLRSRGPPLTDE